MSFRGTWWEDLDNKNYFKLVNTIHKGIDKFPKVEPDYTYITKGNGQGDNPFWDDVFESNAQCCLNRIVSKSQDINTVTLLYETNIEVRGSSTTNKTYMHLENVP